MYNCSGCKFIDISPFDEPCDSCENYRKWKPDVDDRLILIVGASGSGKTTVAMKLEELGYNVIHSYTTREPREPNEWGHIFVDSRPSNLPYQNVLAYFKGYTGEYWATKEQYQGKGTSIYVIDPNGAKEVMERIDDAEITTIFLQADRETRKTRMLADPKRTKLLVGDRLRADNTIFEVVKCDYVINANMKSDYVLENVVKIIEGVK